MKTSLFFALALLFLPACNKEKTPAKQGATENASGVSITANDDKAEIKVEGKEGKVSVKADDDKAEIKVVGKEGKVSVKADDDGAEIQAGGVKVKVGKDGVSIGGIKVPE
ncbi:MAG: hypothetical protein JRH20_05195 [Deltaproteobacteria bacterium]|nr:hypothetical protein [Deltaproteobacteria bacterium]